MHTDADTSGSCAPAVAIHDNNNVGNVGKSRLRMPSIIPHVIPAMGINLNHEAMQRQEEIHFERGGGLK